MGSIYNILCYLLFVCSSRSHNEDYLPKFAWTSHVTYQRGLFHGAPDSDGERNQQDFGTNLRTSVLTFLLNIV